MNKRFFLYIAIFCALHAEVFASERSLNMSFAGIFDEGIYDQTPIPQRPDITDPKQMLALRKEEQLTKKYLSTLTEKIKGFKKAMGSRVEGLDRVMDDFRRNPFAGFSTTVYSIGSWIEGVFGRRRDERWSQRRLDAGQETDNPHLEFEITKIHAEMKAVQGSLCFEPVLPLEERYVQKKRLLPVPLQTAVERSLILYRECSGHLLAIERTFVEQALSLPFDPRRILRDGHETNDMRSLIDRTRARFSTFSEDIRQELIRVVVDMANFSMVGKDYDGARRVVRYFWGNPGGGKTTSVQALAEIVGLPVEKVSIRSMEDLSGPPLRGEDRLSYSSGNKHGWFLSPLLHKASGGRTYNNAILLIDDIDLELGADEVLSTLKLYLDPTTRIFHSPYFASPIDVSRMHVFVTSNQKIPEAPTDRATMDKYAALRSRVKQVHFPIFGITEESLVLRAYVETEARARSIGFLDRDTEISLSIRAAKSGLMAAREEPDMRNMRASIADLMTHVQIARMHEALSVQEILGRALHRATVALEERDGASIVPQASPSMSEDIRDISVAGAITMLVFMIAWML